MSVICSKYLSTGKFNYNPATKTFVADISDLEGVPFARVYDDSCDEGFVMISKMTGVEVVYVIGHVAMDDDGDLQYWDLVPISKSGNSYLREGEPGYGTFVRIFND